MIRAKHIALGAGGISLFAATGCTLLLGLEERTAELGEGDGGTAGAAPDSGQTCQSKCSDPSTLEDCHGASTSCAFDCVNDGNAHCTEIYPTTPAQTSDLTIPGTSDINLSQDTRFVTETGAIDNLRPANTDPLKMEVHGGIGFRLAKGGSGQNVGVWTYKSLTIASGVTVHFNATNAAAFIAANSISIVGIVDARGHDAGGVLCADNAAGPGGSRGGDVNAVGQGLGGGQAADQSGLYSGGPSGAGFGANGGAGADGTEGMGTAAGAGYGTLALSPLLGGSGGGGAAAPGGGGGGAIQLVAGVKISIGGGATVGGINAGGCNGHKGFMGYAGSAGGSGGAILIEAPSFELLTNGVLAANGGGGATGGSGEDAQPGKLSSMQAYGTIGTGGYGFGGDGGHGLEPAGGKGTAGMTPGGAGGAGGGAVGRIRINNRSGSFAPVVPENVSPALGIVMNAPSTVGSIDIH